MFISRKIAKFGALAAMLLSASSAWAEGVVRLPNGDYFERVEDIRVKVLGGNVAVSRTWLATNVNRKEYRWFVNPAWADLDFEYDAADASVKTVVRAGAKFERGGDGIYVLDKTEFFARAADAEGKTTGWRWYDRGGNWMTFTASGKPLSYGDRNDLAVRFEREDPEGPIRRVMDHHGTLALTLGYTAGKLTSVVDRESRRVQYVWSGDDLVEVVDVLGHRWKYEYSGGLMTKKTDPEQHFSTIEYAGGRAWRITDPAGAVKTWEYDYNRSRREYTITQKGPEASRLVKQVFGADGRRLGEIVGTRSTYALRRDGDAVDVETDESGATTRTTRDANGNVTKVINADGTSRTAKYDPVFNVPVEEVDELGVRTVREYDAKGNLKKLVEASGTAVQRTTTFAYDEFGQATTMTIEGAAADDDVSIVRTYDDYGNVATLTDGEGKVTTFEHDAAGRQTLRIDARGKRWPSRYNAAGWLVESENPLGEKVVYGYDKVGNIVRKTDPLGKSVVSAYYANDMVESSTFPSGAVDRFEYTKDKKPRKITDARGVAMTAEYDADGRRTKVTDPSGDEKIVEYDDDGDRPSAIRWPGYCDAFSYDQRGRRTRIVRATPCTGAARVVVTTATAYDAKGRVVSQTDGLGRATLSQYDALGRLRQVTSPDGAATRYEHDAIGNLVSIVDASGGTSTFRFDKMRRLVAESTPLGATIRYRYDATGNLVERTNAAGDRRAYAYDDAGRKVSETIYAHGSARAEQTVVFRYDRRGNLEGYAQSGDTTTSAGYVYDDDGRRTGETVRYGANPVIEKSIAYDYWGNGLVKGFTYPDGTAASYVYDARNFLESMSLPGGGAVRWSNYVWRRAGRIEAPGVVTNRAVDGRNRVTRTTVTAIGGGSANAPAGATLMGYADDFDAAGNIVERTIGTETFAYAYDAMDRLTGVRNAAGGSVEQYTYDPSGNRLSSSAAPGEWRYDADNRLLSFGLGGERRKFDYDANGQSAKVFVGDGAAASLELRYDAAERLREVVRDGRVVGRYQYDPFGRRIRKETDQGVVWFQYSEDGLVAEFDGSGSPQRLYGWTPGKGWSGVPVWQAVRNGSGWAVRTYQVDYAGTPVLLADADGSVVWSMRSNTFGDVETVVGSGNPLRFPGQYADDESGLRYNWRRSYMPSTGRYLEWDPLRGNGDPNPYGYAGANPLRYVDPNGLKLMDVCNCNQDTKDAQAPWVGGSGSISGMVGILGFNAGTGIYQNVLTGETCVTYKYCLRGGIGEGLSGGVAAEGQMGPWCGKDMDDESSCEVSMTGVVVGGARAQVKLPPISLGDLCKGPSSYGHELPAFAPRGGGLSARAGEELSFSVDYCVTQVSFCLNTPCACKK